MLELGTKEHVLMASKSMFIGRENGNLREKLSHKKINDLQFVFKIEISNTLGLK